MNQDQEEVKNITVTIDKPFDPDSGGDCIIRTSDKADFHIHRNILALASSVFADMFSLPQPPSGGSQSTVPVVDVLEDALTVDTLLRSVYPVYNPVVESLDLASSLVLAAEKYIIPPDHLPLRSLLRSDKVLSTEPIRAYAMAWRLGFREEASRAAGYTHNVDLSDPNIKRQIVEGSGGFEALIALYELRNKRATHLIVVARTISTYFLICQSCQKNSRLVEMHVRNLEAGLKDALDRPPSFPQDIRTFWGLRDALSQTCQTCASQSDTMALAIGLANNFWEQVRNHPATIEWPGKG